MKTIAKNLAIIILSASAFFSSCVSKKKMQANMLRIEQLKKDSIETHRRLEAKLATKQAHVEKKSSGSEAHIPSPTIKKKEQDFSPLPPIEVAAVFKAHFPYASEIVWTKEVPLIKTNDKNTNAYKVNFLLGDKKNAVIYSEQGELIETRMEILPDQLPENIYEAIKNKYPDMSIVAATTYKNAKLNGSYTAIIKSKKHEEEKAVILTEKGMFVE